MTLSCSTTLQANVAIKLMCPRGFPFTPDQLWEKIHGFTQFKVWLGALMAFFLIKQFMYHLLLLFIIQISPYISITLSLIIAMCDKN